MKGNSFLGLSLVAIVAAALLWWGHEQAPLTVPVAPRPAAPADLASGEPIQSVPLPPHQDPARVAVGEKLFHDVRVSRDNSTACATCHRIDYAGVDGLPHSPRVGGTLTPLHTPSIFNVSLNFRLFWDGRKKTLEEQIEKPRDTQTEWRDVLAKLRNDPAYRAAFSRAYPNEGMTEATLKDAIVSFERSLLTPGSRFDRYLGGEQQAITEREKSGYRLFKDYGCATCHQGVNVGGNLYQKLGIMQDYFVDRPITEADLGRYNVTKLEADKHVFRVPSLRNVAVTPPYFHDGSVPTLHDAIHEMAQHQLGRPIPEQDVELIDAFLHTLTGQYRGKPLQRLPQ